VGSTLKLICTLAFGTLPADHRDELEGKAKVDDHGLACRSTVDFADRVAHNLARVGSASEDQPVVLEFERHHFYGLALHARDADFQLNCWPR